MIARKSSITLAAVLLASSFTLAACGGRETTTEVTRSTTVQAPIAPVPAVTSTTTTVEQVRR